MEARAHGVGGLLGRPQSRPSRPMGAVAAWLAAPTVVDSVGQEGSRGRWRRPRDNNKIWQHDIGRGWLSLVTRASAKSRAGAP